MPPGLGLEVVRRMQWTKMLVLEIKSATSKAKIKISAIVSISIIMKIDLYIHETRSGVLARQGKAIFHVMRGMNVARSPRLLVNTLLQI